MKKALNFILNQLGFVIAIAIGILLYRGEITLDWYSGTIIVLIFITVFVTSQAVYKSLQRDQTSLKK